MCVIVLPSRRKKTQLVPNLVTWQQNPLVTKNSLAQRIYEFSRLLVSAESSNLENLYMCCVRL